jgi:hypothetical protein
MGQGRRETFCSASRSILANIHPHENLHESPDVDPRGDNLHDCFCSGKSELQKDAQELPDEQQEGMQLR